MRRTTRYLLKKSARFFGLAALAFTGFQHAQAMPFDDVIVFGDSTVDSGNRHILEGFTFAPPQLGYFDGRISNGRALGDWITFWASGASSAEPSLNGGNNFSYAGARLRDNTNDLGPNSDTTPDLTAQVGAFLSANPGGPNPNDLVVISAGGNDLRDLSVGIPALLPPPPMGFTAGDFFIAQAIESLVTNVVALELAGASNILIISPPDVSVLPEALAFAQTQPDPAAFLQASKAAVEQARDALFGALAVRPTAGLSDLRTFDLITFQNTVFGAPGDFGFADDINTTTPCIGLFRENGAPDVDCSGFTFFDAIHATSPFYRVTGREALRQTFGVRVSEPATLALLGLGLASIVSVRRRTAA
jgi:phospholipase/lecithinase/hemolysin